MAKIYITEKYGLLAGTYDDPDLHSHYYLHLIISMDQAFEVCLGVSKRIETTGIILDSDIPHTVNNNDNMLLVFLVESTTDIADSLRKTYLYEKLYAEIPGNRVTDICDAWEDFNERTAGLDEPMELFKKFAGQIFTICGLRFAANAITDERIAASIERIEKCEGIYENTVGALARGAGLSVSRFSHLFKEQTGISLRSYLAYKKADKAYHYSGQGMSTTDAALKAGFASLSHFNDTHRRMFGIAMPDVVKRAEIYFDSTCLEVL